MVNPALCQIHNVVNFARKDSDRTIIIVKFCLSSWKVRNRHLTKALSNL